ncbi:MAG: HAMP domain-containing protein [Prevotella sp.]
MSPIKKIRTSFTWQLTLWVAGFVLVISGAVMFLLARFSQDVIHNESIDTTQQALENTALRLNNMLNQAEMTARLEHRSFRVNRVSIERLVEENDFENIIRQSLPHAELFVSRRDSSQLSSFIAGDEQGYRRMLYEGREIFIFSQPIGDRAFNLAAVCPAQDIYEYNPGVQWFILLRGGIGVLILLYIIFLVVARHLRPLHLLADAAQSIASGNLDPPIPEAHHEHETGRLQNSLKKMQTSLATYMAEMQQKQGTLSQQNTALQAAYSEAQAYEALREKILSSMTERMAAPVAQICSSTKAVCRDYDILSKAEMTALQTDIMQATQTITELLDELMDNSSQS